MKKSLHMLFFTCLVLATISATAQPTLTGAGVNPYIGATFTTNNCDYVNEGNAGANQTWDLSSMTITNSNQITIKSPSNTPNGSSFPNANLAWTGAGGSGETGYYNGSSSSLEFHGMDVPGTVTISYNDPEDLLRFPFTYNDTYTDTWGASFTGSGMTFHREGTSTITADGYGTLITPEGTFNNVLRVHINQVYQDSANIAGSPYILNYNADTYIWYKEGYHSHLASTYSLSSTAGPQTYSSYSSNPPVSTEEINAEIKCKIYPNPADKIVNITTSISQEDVELRLFNALGQEVNAPAAINGSSIQLDVAELHEGLYFLQLINDDKLISTRRLMVKH